MRVGADSRCARAACIAEQIGLQLQRHETAGTQRLNTRARRWRRISVRSGKQNVVDPVLVPQILEQKFVGVSISQSGEEIVKVVPSVPLDVSMVTPRGRGQESASKTESRSRW